MYAFSVVSTILWVVCQVFSYTTNRPTPFGGHLQTQVLEELACLVCSDPHDQVAGLRLGIPVIGNLMATNPSQVMGWVQNSSAENGW